MKTRLPAILTVSVVLLTLAVGLTSIASAAPPKEGHRLVQAADVVAFGNPSFLMPLGTYDKSRETNPNGIKGWDEAYAESLVIGPRTEGEFGAIILSRSYKFPTAESARSALQAVNDPERAFSWNTRGRGADLLDSATRSALDHSSSAWSVWHGIDSEDFPAYQVWIQIGTYVAEIDISFTAGHETQGRALLGQLIRITVSRDPVSDPIPAAGDSSVGQASLDGSVNAIPLGYYADVRSTWIDVEPNWEYRAVWYTSYAYNPHYFGLGGDAATCASDHGCISNWNYYYNVPGQARLGIPKSFILPQSCCGANDPHNYQSTIWID